MLAASSVVPHPFGAAPDSSRRLICAPAHRLLLPRIAQGAHLMIDLPWLAADALGATTAPANPSDGPAVLIERCATAPKSHFPLYFAVSVSVDGGYKWKYLARTKGVLGREPVWGEKGQMRHFRPEVAPCPGLL